MINNGVISIGIIENCGANGDLNGLLTARFVHYPDCQQLQIWLPEYGGNYNGYYRVIDLENNRILQREKIIDKLNGSIQLLLDTISLENGNYVLEIDHNQGFVHQLFFTKQEEIHNSKTNIPVETKDIVSDTMWKVYKDGFGNEIPNEDQLIRNKTLESMKKNWEDYMKNNFNDPYEISQKHQFSSDIINQALSFSSEWGDNYMKPIHNRMKLMYPTLDEDGIEFLSQYVREVEYFIYDLASKANDGIIAEQSIVIKAKEKYPWMSHNNASRLAGIGMYYANK